MLQTWGLCVHVCVCVHKIDTTGQNQKPHPCGRTTLLWNTPHWSQSCYTENILSNWNSELTSSHRLLIWCWSSRGSVHIWFYFIFGICIKDICFTSGWHDEQQWYFSIHTMFIKCSCSFYTLIHLQTLSPYIHVFKKGPMSEVNLLWQIHCTITLKISRCSSV